MNTVGSWSSGARQRHCLIFRHSYECFNSAPTLLLHAVSLNVREGI